jgi:hypothetical protein
MVTPEEIYPGRFFKIPYGKETIESAVYVTAHKNNRVWFKVDDAVREIPLEEIKPIKLDDWWLDYLPLDLSTNEHAKSVHQAQMIYASLNLGKGLDVSKVPVKNGRVCNRTLEFNF